MSSPDSLGRNGKPFPWLRRVVHVVRIKPEFWTSCVHSRRRNTKYRGNYVQNLQTLRFRTFIVLTTGVLLHFFIITTPCLVNSLLLTLLLNGPLCIAKDYRCMMGNCSCFEHLCAVDSVPDMHTVFTVGMFSVALPRMIFCEQCSFHDPFLARIGSKIYCNRREYA